MTQNKPDKVKRHNFARPGGFIGVGYAVAIVVLILDQLTKWVMVENLFRPENVYGLTFIEWYFENRPPFPPAGMEVLPFFNLVLVYNTGISFSLLAEHGALSTNMPLILSGIAALIAIGFAIWLTKTDSKIVACGSGLIIGGAVGNILDRLRFGAVVDFLDLHIGDLHWPAFNVADCGIVIGVAVILVGQLRHGHHHA